LIAVSRARSDLVEAFAREVGARRWYGEWRALVGDADLHAVYIATPVHVHAEQAIAAAEAGKHVLCEKPMAMTSAECDRMLAACRANGVRLGVAYYRRFYPAVRRVKAIIDAGEIGAPAVAQMNAFEYFDPPADHPRAWLLRPSIAGGGPMMDFGCHRIEVLMHLFGCDVRQAAGRDGERCIRPAGGGHGRGPAALRVWPVRVGNSERMPRANVRTRCTYSAHAVRSTSRI
jgi:predicted dehydrogenase